MVWPGAWTCRPSRRSSCSLQARCGSCAPRCGVPTADSASGLCSARCSAVMMAAMVWMVAVMDPGDMTAGQRSGGASQTMAGRDMSPGGGVATKSLAGTGRKLTAAVLALVLLAFTLRWLARAFGARQRDARGRAGAGGGRPGRCVVAGLPRAMALGLAVMFVLLL
ncbi:DUF5134 domain-containing protein [Streptomyces acidicola]|uniref:DUF5134 domain-containing protein n=1 Tax=Streptomyces acidicola TaxID=2596892 RepID=UPI00379AB52B